MLDFPVPAGYSCQRRQDPSSGRQVITLVHESGLRLKYLPFPGFAEKFAALTVPFGSIQRDFVWEDQSYRLPAGTAHFLEHCAFEQNEDGGLAGRLAQFGATANAYTTYDHTLYFFQTVDNFPAALFSWLDSILAPQLDQERLAAELPIIQAELAGYRDNPPARLSQLLLENMYKNHPVRDDIGGTADSVASIGLADLQLAHRLFYATDQISLTLAGDLDMPGLLAELAVRAAGWARKTAAVSPITVLEPALPWSASGHETMDLAVPLFLLGSKGRPEPAATAWDRLLLQRTGALLLDTLLSPVSRLTDSLYQEGLISDSFSYYYAAEASFMFFAAGGEAKNPELAAQKLQAGLLEALDTGLDKEHFTAQKKAALGRTLRLTDSAARAGLAQARLNLLGLDIFDSAAIYAKIDLDKALQQFTFLADPATYVTAIIEPREERNHAS